MKIGKTHTPLLLIALLCACVFSNFNNIKEQKHCRITCVLVKELCKSVSYGRRNKLD